jgi:sulfofructose kinase
MKLRLSLSEALRPFDVLTVGENSVDLIAVVDGQPPANGKAPLLDYRELPGGEAATAAVGLARLGWRATYIGRLGDDRFGQFLRHHLTTEGVDVTHARIIASQPNRMALILVDSKTGDRTVLWRRGTPLAVQPEDVDDGVVASARVMLVGSDDVEAMSSAAARARGLGVRTVGDLEHVHSGTGALLRELDVVIMAESFPTALTGERSLGTAIREIAAASNASLVCVTLGQDGCLALVDGHEVRVPAYEVDVVDTTGAGDLFRAGFIARWLAEPETPDVTDLLRFANAVAALNCRAVGAQTAAPRLEEVETLLHG